MAAEYEINIITQSLTESWDFLHQVIFSAILFLQFLLQSFGAYRLYIEVVEQEHIARSISPTFLMLIIFFDISQFFVLCYLTFEVISYINIEIV